tara:strand:- start:71 stop:628 length:558 start_codon:yes stop_codon:yes gene_type:complete
LQLAAAREPASGQGGLIAVTGPPLSGKQALGHYLQEYLPDAIHVTQTDPMLAELHDEDSASLETLLARGRSQLRCGKQVVFSARLSSPEARGRVLDMAREVGVQRLLVEVEGTDPRVLEQAGEVAETLEEIKLLLHSLREALSRYRSLTAGELAGVPTLTVPADLLVEEQVRDVLAGWGRLGATT